MAARCWRAQLLALLAAPVLAASPPPPDAGRIAAHQQLIAEDNRLLEAADRLTTANAPWCPAKVARSGFLLHDVAQYPDAAGARAAFGFAAPILVAALAPQSPAALAGLLPGDAPLALAVGQEATQPLDPGPAPAAPSQSRVAALAERIDAAAARALASEQPLRLTVQRGEQRVELALRPRAACPGIFQIVTRGNGQAGADGRYISVDARLMTSTSEPEALAAIVAHELAHNLLGHRARIDAARDALATIRVTEREADRLAVWLLANAGYDVERAIASFATRGRRGLDLGSATHGRWASRAERMRAEQRALVGRTLPAPPPLLMAAGP